MPIDLKTGGENQTFRPADKRIDTYFTQPSREQTNQQEMRAQEKIERAARQAEREARQSQQAGEPLMSWDAPEFEVYEKSARWYLIAGVLVLAMAVWGLVSNSPIMSITFILIGIVGYIQLQRDPVVRTFSITTTGVLVGKELYPYENIKSFWIFYDPPHTKVVSLHTQAKFLPFVHIPLAGENPVAIHQTLTEYIPEIEQDPSLINTLEQVLHI